MYRKITIHIIVVLLMGCKTIVRDNNTVLQRIPFDYKYVKEKLLYIEPIYSTYGRGKYIFLNFTNKDSLSYNTIVIKEHPSYKGRVSMYSIEVFDGECWNEFHRGSNLAIPEIVCFEPVKYDKIRFTVLRGTYIPYITSFAIYNIKDINQVVNNSK